jgi:hypothetical protein
MKQAPKFTEEDKKIRKQFKVSNIVSSDLNLCAGQGKPSSTQSSLMWQPRQVINPQIITDNADKASNKSYL